MCNIPVVTLEWKYPEMSFKVDPGMTTRSDRKINC